MVSATGRQRGCARRVVSLPLEAEDVVVDPDGYDAAALRRVADLRFLNRFGPVHLLAVLGSPASAKWKSRFRNC